MARKLSQFESYLVHEFVEDYVDGLMSRRDMMRRVLHTSPCPNRGSPAPPPEGVSPHPIPVPCAGEGGLPWH